ncbi:Flp pilus assembly protein TadB [Lipingzhangella halophila]|uniref:Flp pilus assembly protein TadB n=1 Tax=Lipingzhangella halophila TaxID=1783352 RepID=A0A7W7RMX3_9ACTN|nr:type II secretion system F family protein [Lipingzhangella halophila]MBB4934406.1 Flp pilus assembly protein TadB [Lipingzhangella halophila]
MSTLTAALAGACVATGVVLLANGLRRPTLADLLADPSARPAPERTSQGRKHQLGLMSAPLLATVGVPSQRVRRDLAASDHDAADYLAEKALAAGVGVTVPTILASVIAMTDTAVPPGLGIGVGLACLVSCWMAPDVAVRRRAAQRRSELVSATSALADLVVILLAGGAGISGAVTHAAQRGSGWAASRIRLALQTATVHRQPGWQGLADLAARTEVNELSEIASSLQAAEADGARIKTSLTAKAASLRAREATNSESAANERTERMSVPVMGIVLGFLLAILFPAIAQVSAGF